MCASERTLRSDVAAVAASDKAEEELLAGYTTEVLWQGEQPVEGARSSVAARASREAKPNTTRML
jgi:hypothetical protein